jgi:hypothetical protein
MNNEQRIVRAAKEYVAAAIRTHRLVLMRSKANEDGASLSMAAEYGGALKRTQALELDAFVELVRACDAAEDEGKP